MASSAWLATYRTYDSDELAEEIVALKKQSKNQFISQNVGSKGYTRSVEETRDRLNAATRVQAERGRAAMSPMQRGEFGVPDFSGGVRGGTRSGYDITGFVS